MTASTRRADRAYCVKPLDEEQCSTLAAWVKGSSAQSLVDFPDDAKLWLLAHLDGGILWGYREAGEVWKLSADAFPKVSPSLEQGRLQQMRIFFPDREAVVWRTDEGLRGRVLEDPVEEAAQHQKPLGESYLLTGDRLVVPTPRNGFSLVGDARGARHAVPLECTESDFQRGGDSEPGQRRWPLRLEVRHYFQRDANTGIVRICATRLVSVYKNIQD